MNEQTIFEVTKPSNTWFKDEDVTVEVEEQTIFEVTKPSNTWFKDEDVTVETEQPKKQTKLQTYIAATKRNMANGMSLSEALNKVRFEEMKDLYINTARAYFSKIRKALAS